jgi:hypothetical protein
MEAAGIEPTPKSSENTGVSATGGAKSGAVGAQNSPLPTNLWALVKGLSPAERRRLEKALRAVDERPAGGNENIEIPPGLSGG